MRGAYHFFRCNVDAKKQADYFITYLKSFNDNAELPAVIDLETNDGQKKEDIVTAVKVWLDHVETALGRKPIIYSGQYFLQDNLSVAGGGPPTWAKDYPLWLAQYPHQYVPGMQPYLPTGWFNWTFWRYSKRGSINGINADVDLNLFNGTLEDLFKFTGAKPVSPSTSQTPKTHKILPGDTFESIAIKYGVTVRELVSANPQLLKNGELLTIPNAVAIPTESGTSPTSGTTPPPSSQRRHIVKSGDSLYATPLNMARRLPQLPYGKQYFQSQPD